MSNFSKQLSEHRTFPGKDAILNWLICELTTKLGIDPNIIDIRQPFVTYGLTSREGVSLSGDLENWLGRRLSQTLLWDYPTIESLAKYLAEEP
ncbi:MAG: acyl carrier protein [Acidobacteriota bacterium]